MRLFGELGGPGVGNPDLEGTQSLITQSNSVFGDPLPHVTVGHERHVTCNWLVSAPRVEGSFTGGRQQQLVTAEQVLGFRLLGGYTPLFTRRGR